MTKLIADFRNIADSQQNPKILNVRAGGSLNWAENS